MGILETMWKIRVEYPDSEKSDFGMGRHRFPEKRGKGRRCWRIYMLIQKACHWTKVHIVDAVSFGGWAWDLHPARPEFAAISRAVPSGTAREYITISFPTSVPTKYPKTVLSWRTPKSVRTHVAFGSFTAWWLPVRTMTGRCHGSCTCAWNKRFFLADLLEKSRIWLKLQTRDSLKSGQYIPQKL